MRKMTLRRICAAAMAAALLMTLAACRKKHICDFGDWQVEKEATCVEEGVKVRECACGERETRAIDLVSHTYTSAVTTEATCLREGVTTFTCSGCQKTYTEPIAITDHVYTAQETSPATCTREGVTTYTCSGCQIFYIETFPCPTYSSTEIYDLYQDTVGEICVSDYFGNEISLGSGFVYSEDGMIVTNYHVIENGYSAKITLGSQTYSITQVLAYDKAIDVAVLKIDATGLKAAKVCDATHKTGETVYALGSSQGLTSTFSDGMITQSNREIDGVLYTQHDAPISSGNSGGPLINIYGEVIGINTWTLQDSQNLNFAIHPSELQNLNYSKPMTMADFYETECNAFVRIKNYITQYGSMSGGCYCLTLGTDYTSDNSLLERRAYYYPGSEIISLDCVIEDGEYWAYFEFSEDLDGVYDWYYFDDYNRNMYGTLQATGFSDYSSASCSGYYLPDETQYATMLEFASDLLQHLCSNIDSDFSSVNVTAEDLQFYLY